MSCRKHGFLDSLACRLNRPSHSAGPQDYILFPYRDVVDKFLLIVQHLQFQEKGSIKYVAYETILTSPAVSHMFCSSNLNHFRGRWSVSVQLLFRWMLLPGFNIVHSIIVQVPSSLFSMRLVSVYVVFLYYSMDTVAAWKKLRFI